MKIDLTKKLEKGGCVTRVSNLPIFENNTYALVLLTKYKYTSGVVNIDVAWP